MILDGLFVLDVGFRDEGEIQRIEALGDPGTMLGAAKTSLLAWKFQPASENGKPLRPLWLCPGRRHFPAILAAMSLISLVLLAGLRVSSPAALREQAVNAVPTIEVSAPRDVADVQGLNDTMSKLSEKVTTCVNAGGKVETCRCSDPRDLKQLRKDYDGLMKQHPAWKDMSLSYRYTNKEGRSVSGTLVLQNLRRQLELKCSSSAPRRRGEK
jgi:hypothetical protein